MTKGFKKYFGYRLSKSKRSIIVFAILNLLGVLLPSILMYVTYTDMLREVEEIEAQERTSMGVVIVQSVDFTVISLLLIFLIAVISIVIITATTINSMKLYNNRASIDTLGSLPISYGERFFGDFLGGVCSSFISFVPFLVISLILIGNLRNPKYAAIERYFVYEYLTIPRQLTGLFLTMLFIYLGVYAVTMFVSTCCGKKGSAVLYSLITMAVLPGIYVVYGNDMLSRVLGMDAFYELMTNVGMLPPFGPVVAILMSAFYDGNIPFDPKWCMLNENPFYIVVFLIITAAFIAGAYFIGKRRRAENVGESFAFKSAYHVLTLTFMILLIGASFVGYSNLMEDSGIQWVLLLSFIVYAALEISQNKGFKGFWKTAVRFAAVFGACLGFFAIVKSTNAFNMYKALPSASSVKEVRISGKYFYTPPFSYEREYVLNTKSAVSEILGEHKSLLNSNGVETGEELKIVYSLKNGQEVMRSYSAADLELDVIKDFSDTAKNLPDFDFGDLGIIDDPDLSNYTFSLSKNGKPRKYIYEEKQEELVRLLVNDIKYNYSASDSSCGWLMITEKNQKHDLDNDVVVYQSYTATVEFLKNPENYTTEEISSGIDKYMFNYSNEKMSVRVFVSTDDTSPAAKELLSYIKPRLEGDGFDPSKNVRVSGVYSGITYRIDLAHEERAKELMVELFVERH